MKLEFSDISFQPHDDFGYVQDSKDIMYLYYTVCIYKRKTKYIKTAKGSKKAQGWKLVAKRNVYDFPCLIQLIFILDTILHKEMDFDTCRKLNFQSGAIGYEQSLETEGFACDDFYEVKHRVVYEDESLSSIAYEEYCLYAGCSYDTQGDLQSEGIRNSYVTKMDLELLYECATSFLQNGIEEFNQSLRDKAASELFIGTENKLYKHNQKDNAIIDSIYTVGDYCDIIVRVGAITDKDMHSVQYLKTELVEITDTHIVIRNGIIEDENYEYTPIPDNTVIPINRIFHIFVNLDDSNKQRLYFNEEQIMKDFISLLTDSDKEEFQVKSIDELYKKWGDVLIDRSWMFREEHAFPIYLKGKTHQENVKYIAKKIIKTLKTKLT